MRHNRAEIAKPNLKTLLAEKKRAARDALSEYGCTKSAFTIATLVFRAAEHGEQKKQQPTDEQCQLSCPDLNKYTKLSQKSIICSSSGLVAQYY